MITIILEKKDGKIVQKLSKLGNESYLCQENSKYHKLSEVDEFSYSCFSSEDMDKLKKDLTIVSDHLNDSEKRHIEDILTLTEKCQKDESLIMSFTPFKE